ncbi:MAG: hypothetical protein A3J83_03530 [Elusimicrobia bacterium RIFOXYA2_FULL_40_6]|nr:MAG: hypothetical protein A3J83_03530 [Elusimicrobia bacterium RIFOXYA2_FULL_40_6]
MNNVLIIFKKEFRTYFNSPIAYVVIVLFLTLCGIFFVMPLFITGQATTRHLIDLLPLFSLFFVPAITMRLLSEEIKSGTIEILSTLPMTEEEIIIGKYLSGAALYGICIAATLFYPLFLSLLGKIDWGQTIGADIGIIMIGSMFAATGIFSSALSKNQIISFITSFVICFLFFIIGQTAALMPPFLGKIVSFMGISSHLENFSRGILDSRDIIYFISITAFFLYATLAVMKTKK